MKNILKNGFDTIIRMCVSQLGLTMFALMLAFATHNNQTLLIVTSIFSIIFYMFILYIHTWEHGARERVKIDGGRLVYNKFTGLYLSLVANSLNILLGILYAIGYFCGGSSAGQKWAADMYNISKMLGLLLNGMYVGVNRVFLADFPFSLLLMCIPALLVSTVAYILGSNNIGPINKKIQTPVKPK